MLLVRKYAPETISDILGNDDMINILKSLGDDFPHLLLVGPPGTGKTTASHILKSDYHVLELNASDERGIETIRTKVKNFCQKKEERKLVILDECDHLTDGAQQSLRRLMEQSETKFILICNRVSEIIEAVQSRCGILQFRRIGDEEVRRRLREICVREDICLGDDAVETVVDICDGDLRRSINSLESVRRLGEQVDSDFVFCINGIANYRRVEEIVDELRKGDVEECINKFEKVWDEKYEASDLMDCFFRVGKKQENYEVLRTIGKYHTRIIEGTSSKVQFYAMLSELSKIFQ